MAVASTRQLILKRAAAWAAANDACELRRKFRRFSDGVATKREERGRVLINAQIAAPLFTGPATSVVQKIALTR
jgi:hypothetical protein